MSVAIVGAGPAGLIAAALLARRGETVTLIDEQTAFGGHLTYDRYPVGMDGHDSDGWLAELRSAMDSASMTTLPLAIAWAAFRNGEGFELGVNHAGVEKSVGADHLVIAAGTTDLSLIAPGATAPGVMTGRAIRILLNRHGVIPGQRIVVVGVGPKASRLRDDLIAVDCDVVAQLAVAEVVAIAGNSGVEGVQTTDGRALDADLVVVAVGEVPDVQLAGMVDAPRVFDPNLSGWRLASEGVPAGLHVVGGSLLGQATPEEIVQSAVAVADRIRPGGAELRDVGLDISDVILRQEAVQQ
jgi:NADPH-dependent 2,4-dienoyl-CoA reductase/sulfur reductase-like enzyme